MKFFLPAADDDDPATLRELFEVVDAWTPAASDDKSGSGDCGSLSATVSDGRARKRTRNPEVELRRRLKKKEERERLLQHIQELQDELARALQAQRGAVQARKQASTMQQELKDATAINQALRGQVAKNLMLLRAMADELTGNFLFTRSLADMSVSDPYCVQQLFATAQQTASNTPAFGSESILSTNSINVGAGSSPQVETMSGAHLCCDVRRSLEVLASYFKELCPFGRSVQRCIESKGSIAEEEYTMDAPCCDPSSHFATGVVKKRAQGDTVVLVWTSNSFHPSELLNFLGRARVIITPSQYSTADQPMTRVMVQSYYDITSPKPQDGATSIQAALVGAMGKRVQSRHRLFLRSVLSATGRADLAAAVTA